MFILATWLTSPFWRMSASRQERSFIDNHHLRSKYFRTCDQGVESPLDDGNESSDDFRCTPDSGHRRSARPCPKSASNRHFSLQHAQIYSVTWYSRHDGPRWAPPRPI